MQASEKRSAGVVEALAGTALSDTEVVERVRRGDVGMFEILMRRHNRRVYRAVRSILRDEAEVEDAMQDAYVSAFEHLAQFAGNAAFSTWLVRIAVNAALARLRGRRHLVAITRAAEGGAMATSRLVPEPERQAAAREAATLLERAFDSLPEMYRSVFMLREIEEMDTAECATALGVSEDVVKTRLHRARAALREQLLRTVGEGAAEAFHFGGPRCDRVVAGVFARLGFPPA